MIELEQAMYTCRWSEDEDGTYETQCGEAFQFIDSGPAENGFRFCPYCSGSLVITPYQEPEEQ